MSLNKQIHIYSVDTSAFYTDEENKIHKKMNKLYILRGKLKKLKGDKLTEHKKNRIILMNKLVKIRKQQIVELFGRFSGTREFRKEHIVDRNIISIFESTLTRTIGIDTNELNTDLMVIKVYFFQVFENIVKDGFKFNGEEYCIFTASAGQIRTKKAVFINKNVLLKHQNSLTCGLSIDTINNRGGVNINKYLAYLGLVNSATDVWSEFDIDKSIVIEDFESIVNGRVDYIDDKTYVVENNVKKDIEINHTDGVGMFLPSISKKNRMVRLPWVKGLMVSFPYDKFVREKKREDRKKYKDCHIVEDIYGKKWDIFKDDIQFIFTKSQFKMWKYYDGWEQYKENYKKYNCECGMCNEDEDFISNGRINYQFLQSLTNVTDDELHKISQRTRDKIQKIGNCRDTTLKILGGDEGGLNKNYIQKSLSIYPELCSDQYSRNILKQVKKSMVTDGRAAKLHVDCKYTFIIPDLYAFCERLFLGEENPKGLLDDGQVSCKIYPHAKELAVLRSPHLYREWPIRENILSTEIKRWFSTNGIYTSCHDLISRILQFDVDGDKSLVLSDKNLINLAKVHMEDIRPLYYEMKKAKPSDVNNTEIYNGMVKAYTGGNIGIYSNNISKIWNDENCDLDIIKILCAENNYTIDFAKTLYKPERPKEIDKKIKEYTKKKVPHFFIYAKDKEKDKVESSNKSTVNRLEEFIPNTRMNFDKNQFGKFDYTMLKHNKDYKYVDKDIIDKYNYLDKRVYYSKPKERDEESPDMMLYVYQRIRKELLSINPDINYVVDVLVEYLYNHKKTNTKMSLWESFGDVLFDNISTNIENTINCDKCKRRIIKSSNSIKYCEECAAKVESANAKKRAKKQKGATK